MDKDFITEYIDNLFEIGALLPEGMDENGEMTYLWAPDEVLSEIDPDLLDVKKAFEEHVMREIEDQLISLYERGYVEMDIDENNEVVWRTTEKGSEYLG